MWKARPVVASAVGGHLDQVQHRRSGLLVADPADVGAFGDAIVELLQEPPRAARLGQTARERVRALFLNDRHFMRWVEVFGSALEPPAGATRSMGPTAGMPAQPSPGGGALDPGGHDALTGLWNRRRFEQELDQARENAERLALLSIDVDRYRDVIRRHGEAAAQELIQAIAHVLACAPPTPPSTRPRSQAATAPSCTSPRQTPNVHLAFRNAPVASRLCQRRFAAVPGFASSRWTGRPCANCCRCAAATASPHLDWGVGAFRLATSGVADSTRILTPMRYPEFGEILGAQERQIARLARLVRIRARVNPGSPTGGPVMHPGGAPGRDDAIRTRGALPQGGTQ